MRRDLRRFGWSVGGFRVMYFLLLKDLVQSCGRLKGALLLTALVGAVFWPVLEFDFVGWDDDISVTQNPLLTEPWSWSLVAGLFDGSTALRFKPLHWLAFRGIYGLFGLNPVAWHAFGLLLHALAAMLFFSVLKAVLRRVFPDEVDTRLDVVAWLGAALWAVHPLRVEPVAWVTGSTYTLTAVFLLASYRAYLGGRISTACLLAVGAYSSYPVGSTYGLWLIATDAGLLRVAPARPWRLLEQDVRRWWLKHLTFIVPAMFAVGMTIWTRTVAPGIFDQAPPSSVVSIEERLLMAAATLMLLVQKFIWPAALTPNVARLDQPVWADAVLLGAATLTVVAIGTMILARKRRPLAFWLVGGFVALALPCLGLTEYPMPPVDRYSHLVDLVLAGVLAGVGLLTWQQFGSNGSLVAAAGFSVLVTFGWAVASTRVLLPAWRNTDSLFSRMEQHDGFSNNLRQQAHIYRLWARHALSDGRAAEARWRLAQAFAVYREGIAGALRRGDFSQAIELSRSMEVNLKLTPPQRRERGYWLMQLGRWEEAGRDLRAARQAMPEDMRTAELLTRLQTITEPAANQ